MTISIKLAAKQRPCLFRHYNLKPRTHQQVSAAGGQVQPLQSSAARDDEERLFGGEVVALCDV
jgi:hypothetical protein